MPRSGVTRQDFGRQAGRQADRQERTGRDAFPDRPGLRIRRRRADGLFALVLRLLLGSLSRPDVPEQARGRGSRTRRPLPRPWVPPREKPAEIRTLVSKERSGLFATGCMMGGLKCTLLRDSLHTDGENTMDIRTKATEQHPETFNICAGKSHKALVIVRGKKDSHGGSLNKIVHKMITHLKASGY